MHLHYEPIELVLRHTFHIAHGASDTRRNVIVAIGDGMGEAAPVAYHHESADGVMDTLNGWRSEIDALAEPTALHALLRRLQGSRAARASVDLALHDALGKQLGCSLADMFGLRGLPLPPTSFTIALTAPDELPARVREAAQYPILKIKLGGTHDLATVQTIREHAPSTRIRVDANAGWTAEQALDLVPQLAELGVELIEQPLAVGDHEGLARLKRARLGVPIVADESVRTAADIVALAAVIDGVNIKLMKTGGIAGALEAIHVARSCGLKIMLGCMIETSLGVTAAAHLAPLADSVDLDGPLLIGNDPFEGVQFEGANLRLPDGPGLGAVPRQLM
jgi:L-alanine-DL-glutamate epimerase-like enolase superfamily enzyme